MGFVLERDTSNPRAKASHHLEILQNHPKRLALEGSGKRVARVQRSRSEKEISDVLRASIGS